MHAYALFFFSLSLSLCTCVSQCGSFNRSTLLSWCNVCKIDWNKVNEKYSYSMKHRWKFGMLLIVANQKLRNAYLRTKQVSKMNSIFWWLFFFSLSYSCHRHCCSCGCCWYLHHFNGQHNNLIEAEMST